MTIQINGLGHVSNRYTVGRGPVFRKRSRGLRVEKRDGVCVSKLIESRPGGAYAAIAKARRARY